MVVIDRTYTGGAVVTIARASFTPSTPGAGNTFSVDDDTGYPTSGKFPIKLSKGQSDEEHVLIASRSGKVFTIDTRGYDDTVAQAHTNPTCELYFDARTATLLGQHVDDVEVDPHSTKLLNNARHDITARHVYGGALGTRPVPVATGTAAAAGSGAQAAAGDHVHPIGVGSINNANQFAAGIVNTAAIGNNQITNALIATGAVTSASILDGTIVLADLAAALQAFLVPTGTCVPFAAAVAPTGWQLCDGTAISRAANAALFSLLGITWGAGNGTTTFNVPDLRQRFVLGQAASGTGAALASVGGSIDHTHPLDGTDAVAMVEGQAAGNISPQWRRKSGIPSWTANISSNSGLNTQAGSTAFTTGAQLGGNTQATNPPFAAMPYIIKL